TAGSGKSTLGDNLARKLGYLYIDTGAMYRAIAWLALIKKIDIYDETGLEALTENADIVMSKPYVDDGRQYTVSVGGQDVTWNIREARVSRVVATVSSHSKVRAILIDQQRMIAQQEKVVMVGRDIGTVVLPDADLKIFLDADPRERARRRYKELVRRQSKGTTLESSMKDVLDELIRRDEIDRVNMKPAKDAVCVLTDNFSAEEILEMVTQRLEELPKELHVL
ncbi:MAG: (d)CMP kinase, partial [Ktedonobacteraceae bacterium]|nr:(d)CMP kinase [Ktedonobacteraceae bacterium]